MNKTRLEAFSDGVIAIIITIMVLELKTPLTEGWRDIAHMLLEIGSYLLSFVFVATFWGNHHHVVQTVKFVNAKIMWANNLLLFCLSLIPFATHWMIEKRFDSLTVAAYSVVLLLCSIAFYILQQAIISEKQLSTRLNEAFQKQSVKGIICLLLYFIAIPLAYVHVAISIGIFIFQGIWWMIPNKGIELALREGNDE
jgi:uncharacterized membrane protein